MSFLANLDKSTYLTKGDTTTGAIMGTLVDGQSPQFWTPMDTSSTPTKTTQIMYYLIPSAIVFGAIYIVFSDGRMR